MQCFPCILLPGVLWCLLSSVWGFVPFPTVSRVTSLEADPTEVSDIGTIGGLWTAGGGWDRQTTTAVHGTRLGIINLYFICYLFTFTGDCDRVVMG